MGNSPEDFFVGPEHPGQKLRPEGGFKDHAGRVKRQAARFRIYALDKNGEVLGEVTENIADIIWTVHLANRKAAFLQFHGRFKMPDHFVGSDPEKYAKDFPLRNAGHKGPRGDLIIDPGPRSVTGANASGVRFDTGAFLGKTVPLGELRTDPDGRLLVLGGAGASGTTRPNNPIVSYANNDFWYDDTSDGPVSAKVVFHDNSSPEVRPARVIVAPPNFAPEIENLTTLYDVCVKTGRALGLPQPEAQVSFTHDVYPILYRMARYQWVNEEARRGHGPGAPGDFLAPDFLDLLSLKAGRKKGRARSDGDVDRARAARKAVFGRMRDPGLDFDSAEAVAQANYRFMPLLSGDGGDTVEGDPRTWMRVLPSQYVTLKAWAEDAFEDDWPGMPPRIRALEDISLGDRPLALVRGALQPCVGAPMYPGIEMTFISHFPEIFEEPFVLRPDIGPGEITQYMALPWQADFYQCNTHWWPAQRPDAVVTETAYNAVFGDLGRLTPSNETTFEAEQLPGLAPPSDDAQVVTWARERFAYREPWARGVATSFDGRLPAGKDTEDVRGSNALVDLWDEMGFLVSKPSPVPRALRSGGANGGSKARAALWNPEDRHVYVETERAPFAGINLREFYYYLSNIDSFPEFLPKARWLADYFLKRSWDRQYEVDYPESWRFFEYSEELYETRMHRIYDELVHLGNKYNPADPNDNPLFRTREEFLFRIVNFAPFNQNDGAWLHKATPAGPLDEVQSLLFSIWMDEAGDGEVHQSHCNIYTDLLKGLGVYLPDPRSRAYALDKCFLDSAFAVPVLELAIAQFSQEYIPELIGFTLQLEWTVPGLVPVEKLCDWHGVDDHFYRLHIGIDNAADGHGAKAKEAVKLYLDNVRATGGDETMQEHWRRIWNGFLAFGDTGSMGEDLKTEILRRRSTTPEDAVLAIVSSKAKYGKLNHRDKSIGVNLINNWFLDPKGFLDALVEADYILPGRPEESKFFDLTSFNGPMFKVFNDRELESWKRWTVWLGDKDKHSGDGAARHPGVAMAEAIETLQAQAEGEPAHDAMLLKGVDPSTGETVRQSVTWWLTQVRRGVPDATQAFMRALADPSNGMIAPGDLEGSVLLNDYLSVESRMGQAFERIGAGDRTFRDVTIGWIAAGCPIPAKGSPSSAAHSLQHPPPPDVHPQPRIRGMGGIH